MLLLALALLAVAAVARAYADQVPALQRPWRNAFPHLVCITALLILIMDGLLLIRFDAPAAVVLAAAGLLLVVAARRRAQASQRHTQQLARDLHRRWVALRRLPR